MSIVSKLSLEGRITEQHAKEIEEIIESHFQERLKEILPGKKTSYIDNFEEGYNLCIDEILKSIN